jgi:hypothetical protein
MRTYVDPETTNGGFPEPPPGAPVRVVRAEHGACGAETRLRLPSQLPAAAVRRVVCQGCAQPYEAPVVEELELIDPDATSRGRLLSWLRDPRSRTFRLASLGVGAAAVIGALALIQGPGGSDDGDAGSPASAAAAAEVTRDSGHQNGNAAADAADLVRQSSFSLALPPGWQRANPPSGATFAAAGPGGEADVTLWVNRSPQLSFAEFEADSLSELRSLAGSAREVDRVTGPSAEDAIVTLAADAPAGSPRYEVTLRASGPYRYYLATTLQPDASAAAAGGVKLIQNSFVPTGTG